MYNLLLEN
jgi:ABC-type uncharacterized transport system fused permease/ATPase subunit